MAVKIVTDSACDLPQSLVDDFDIAIVSLTVRFGDEEFVDRVDLTPSQFWTRCSSSAVLPETAAPSPGAFGAAFQAALDGQYDEVVCINLSGALSATIQAADAAAKSMPDATIEIVDSRTVSMGQGTIVLAAAQAARDGKSATEIATMARELATRTRVHAALDTLENLKKGGRIGAAQSLLGSLLSIKPMIAVVDGVVEPSGKQRTRARALNSLVDIVSAAGAIEGLAVMHAACSDLDDFVGRLAEIYDGDIVVGDIGAIIGAHAGAGTIGVTFQVPG
jgi:DegV family protein with EDD domain